MEYSIRELAEMSGVSVRALRWYDAIGLLKPSRVSGSGYRFYSSREADRLQQILFYRALGVNLKQIAALLDRPGFDRMTALRSHLDALQSQRKSLDAMILALRKNISAEERKERIMDREKFEAFKHASVAANEEKYGKEIRAKYGNAAVDESNRRAMDMTAGQYDEKQALEKEILARLEQAVNDSVKPDSDEGRAIAQLHRRWLEFSWTPPSDEAYRGLAQMYVMDERFTKYYDRTVPGCAKFLCDAIHHL